MLNYSIIDFFKTWQAEQTCFLFTFRDTGSGFEKAMSQMAIFGTEHNISRGRDPQLPSQGCFPGCGVQRQPLCSLRVLLQSDAVEQWAVSSSFPRLVEVT